MGYLKDVIDTNVIGVIRGEEEPDRYVLLSNHRDAWGYGAIDPSSGTTALMETARVLGNLHKTTGWRPRRTIVFASWATEDIQKLEELGISLEGRIAISRYGKIYRGNRLENCEKAGAIGVIMFSDPEDVASQGVNASQVYPNSFFLPESGIQRGSTIM